MLTALIMLLLLAAGALLVLRRPRGAGGFLVAALALLWLGGNGMLAAQFLRPLQTPYARVQAPPWGARNAIVVLGGGAVKLPAGPCQPTLVGYARLQEAVRLYRECRASGRPCVLILSGADALRVGATEAAVYREGALALGVPDADLVQEPRSFNTFQNAEFSGALLRAGGYERTVLVTSALHMKRSQLYFGHFHLACLPVPADYAAPLPGWAPNGFNLTLADLALHEHLGILRYRIYEAMGWNG